MVSAAELSDQLRDGARAGGVEEEKVADAQYLAALCLDGGTRHAEQGGVSTTRPGSALAACQSNSKLNLL